MVHDYIVATDIGLGGLSRLGALSQLSQPSNFSWRVLNTRCVNYKWHTGCSRAALASGLLVTFFFVRWRFFILYYSFFSFLLIFSYYLRITIFANSPLGQSSLEIILTYYIYIGEVIYRR
jgi:hypothetical protein